MCVCVCACVCGGVCVGVRVCMRMRARAHTHSTYARLSLTVSLPLCLPIALSLCFVFLSLYLPVCLTTFQLACLCVCLCVFLWCVSVLVKCMRESLDVSVCLSWDIREDYTYAPHSVRERGQALYSTLHATNTWKIMARITPPSSISNNQLCRASVCTKLGNRP